MDVCDYCFEFVKYICRKELEFCVEVVEEILGGGCCGEVKGWNVLVKM